MPHHPDLPAETGSCLPVSLLSDRFQAGIHTVTLQFTGKELPTTEQPLPPALADRALTPYHSHEGIEMLCIREGECELLLEDECIPVRHGDILFINPFETHALLSTDSTSELQRSSILFRPSDLFPIEDPGNRFFSELTLFRFLSHLPATHPAAPPCRELAFRICSLCREARESWAVEAYAALLSVYAIAASHGLRRHHARQELYLSAFSEKVHRYIEEHLSEDITTADVAAYCQYTTEHFCRLFKKSFGTTFKEHLNICRIRRARDYMDTHHTTALVAVSSRFGFNNQNHFGRMFKKYIGLLPSEYLARRSKAASQN